MSEGAEAETKRVIAIGVDGSPHAKEAFNFYVKNMRRETDKIYLIYAVEINSVLHSTQWYNTPYSFDKELLLKLLEEEKERIKTKLEDFAQWLKDEKIDGIVKSVHAETPGEGILKAATEIHASVIVCGSRGMGIFRRTILGSVSDYLIHHAHVPVLICKHESDHHPQHEQQQQQQQQQHSKKQ